MLKRAGLSAKYKEYTKSIKALKAKISSKGTLNYSIDNVSISKKVANCVEAMQSVNRGIVASSYVQKSRHFIQNEIDKLKTTELSNKTIQIKIKLDVIFNNNKIRKWASNPRIYRAAAVGIFSTSPASDAVKVTGYNNKDNLELMKLLGITQPSEVVQTNAAAEAALNQTDILKQSNANISSAYESTNAFQSSSFNNATESADIEIPPINEDLFKNLDYKYPSPFDNMPPMRNEETGFFINIYKTLTGQNDTPPVSKNKTSEQLFESENVAPNLEADVFENEYSESGTIDFEEPIKIINDNITPLTEIRFSSHDSPLIASNSSTESPLLASFTNNSSESLLTAVGDTTVPNIAEVIPSIINDSSTKLDLSPIIENIPEPPPIPDAVAELASQLNELGEQTFASLGLGGWTPVGMVQNCFEYLHVGLGIPWWEAIAIGTLVIRFAMFPLVVIAQRNAAKMNNHLPQLQLIQLKMTEARQSGNQLEAARYSQELMLFMKEKSLNPLKNMIVPLAQMPIFVSFFMGLRQMANVPVDSLRDGGMLWFTDLTMPDQFFALPIITSFTLWATIELGTDSAKLSSQNLQTMKYVLRAMPICILPFTVNFPGAILCYWVASNFISLGQVGFLRIPAVRDYFKIDALVKHNPANLPVKNKGFVGGIKDSWTNLKITKEMEDRKRIDDLQFQRAGKGPIIKTYKFDPTKQVSTPRNAISAKKR